MSEVIQERLEEIRQKFAGFTDPDDKWKFLLDLAKAHPGMDASLKAEKFIIQGCASTMYLVPRFADGKIHFEMDVEGGTTNPLISRGLGALALKVTFARKPAAPQAVIAAFMIPAFSKTPFMNLFPTRLTVRSRLSVSAVFISRSESLAALSLASDFLKPASRARLNPATSFMTSPYLNSHRFS